MHATEPMLRNDFSADTLLSEKAMSAAFFFLLANLSNPLTPDRAINAPFAAAVLGALRPNESTKRIWPSCAFLESAIASALARILAGIERAKTFSLRGPCATPPPFQIGERM